MPRSPPEPPPNNSSPVTLEDIEEYVRLMRERPGKEHGTVLPTFSLLTLLGALILNR